MESTQKQDYENAIYKLSMQINAPALSMAGSVLTVIREAESREREQNWVLAFGYYLSGMIMSLYIVTAYENALKNISIEAKKSAAIQGKIPQLEKSISQAVDMAKKYLAQCKEKVLQFSAFIAYNYNPVYSQSFVNQQPAQISAVQPSPSGNNNNPPPSQKPTPTTSTSGATDRDGESKDINVRCKPYEEDVFAEGSSNCTNWFRDIVGKQALYAANELKKGVLRPFQYPGLFKVPTKGILLYGPPGTGKTLIVKAAVNELNSDEFVRVLFYDIGAETVKSFKFGGTEKAIKGVFECAKWAVGTWKATSKQGQQGKKAISVLFMDEFDSLAPSRSGDDKNAKVTVNSLLREIDGIKSSAGVIIIAATNEPWSLDSAILSRFDKQILLSNPTKGDIEKLINKSLDKQLSDSLYNYGFGRTAFKDSSGLTVYRPIQTKQEGPKKEEDVKTTHTIGEDRLCKIDNYGNEAIIGWQNSEYNHLFPNIKPEDITDICQGMTGREVEKSEVGGFSGRTISKVFNDVMRRSSERSVKSRAFVITPNPIEPISYILPSIDSYSKDARFFVPKDDVVVLDMEDGDPMELLLKEDKTKADGKKFIVSYLNPIFSGESIMSADEFYTSPLDLTEALHTKIFGTGGSGKPPNGPLFQSLWMVVTDTVFCTQNDAIKALLVHIPNTEPITLDDIYAFYENVVKSENLGSLMDPSKIGSLITSVPISTKGNYKLSSETAIVGEAVSVLYASLGNDYDWLRVASTFLLKDVYLKYITKESDYNTYESNWKAVSIEYNTARINAFLDIEFLLEYHVSIVSKRPSKTMVNPKYRKMVELGAKGFIENIAKKNKNEVESESKRIPPGSERKEKIYIRIKKIEKLGGVLKEATDRWLEDEERKKKAEGEVKKELEKQEQVEKQGGLRKMFGGFIKNIGSVIAGSTEPEKIKNLIDIGTLIRSAYQDKENDTETVRGMISSVSEMIKSAIIDAIKVDKLSKDSFVIYVPQFTYGVGVVDFDYAVNKTVGNPDRLDLSEITDGTPFTVNNIMEDGSGWARQILTSMKGNLYPANTTADIKVTRAYNRTQTKPFYNYAIGFGLNKEDFVESIKEQESQRASPFTLKLLYYYKKNVLTAEKVTAILNSQNPEAEMEKKVKEATNSTVIRLSEVLSADYM